MRLLVTRGQGGVTIIRVRAWGRLDTLTTAHTVRESANTTHHYYCPCQVTLSNHLVCHFF